jgi:hypothetical protein
MKEYKVLTQNNGLFGGKFKPEKLETVLNDLAREGWIVVTATTSEIKQGLGKPRNELVIVLERTAR